MNTLISALICFWQSLCVFLQVKIAHKTGSVNLFGGGKKTTFRFNCVSRGKASLPTLILLLECPAIFSCSNATTVHAEKPPPEASRITDQSLEMPTWTRLSGKCQLYAGKTQHFGLYSRFWWPKMRNTTSHFMTTGAKMFVSPDPTLL